MMFGKKVWTSKKGLLEFGTTYCLLSSKEALKEFNMYIEAVFRIRAEIEDYMEHNDAFYDFGKQFISIIDFSLTQNLDKEYKEISNGIL